jgi:hypothetical protein
LRNEKTLIDIANKTEWYNKNDEASGLIRMSISSNLWFHLQGIEDLGETRDKLEAIFGKHIMRFDSTNLNIN